MELSATWIVWPIILPLVAAVLVFLFRQGAAIIGLAAAAGVLLSVIALATTVLTAGVQQYAVAGWEAPLGIRLHADGLSVLLLGMTAVVGVLTSVYAASYWGWRNMHPEGNYFWPLWMFLWAALNAIFLAGDLFNLYVGFELLSLAAVALVTIAGKRAALVAGMRYLLVSLLGSLAYLLGVALLYGAFGTLDAALLATVVVPGPATWAAIALIMGGMALKTALFPLHFWLPPAHASAPAPVSALLSALVVKASFYLLLRLWFDVFPAARTPNAGLVLGALGALAIIYGSILALRQRRLKLLIAYSTVAQIGYLFILFPLASSGSAWGDMAWTGGVYHALAHACAKAAMFLAAGTLAYALGDDALDTLGGSVQHFPLSITAFALAGVSLMGLPPSGGFTAKWLLLSAAWSSEQWWLVATVLLGSLLAAGYVFRALQRTLAAPAEVTAVPRVARGMELSALTLAVLALLLGLVSAPLLELLSRGAPV